MKYIIELPGNYDVHCSENLKSHYTENITKFGVYSCVWCNKHNLVFVLIVLKYDWPFGISGLYG